MSGFRYRHGVLGLDSLQYCTKHSLFLFLNETQKNTRSTKVKHRPQHFSILLHLWPTSPPVSVETLDWFSVITLIWATLMPALSTVISSSTSGSMSLSRPPCVKCYKLTHTHSFTHKCKYRDKHTNYCPPAAKTTTGCHNWRPNCFIYKALFVVSVYLSSRNLYVTFQMILQMH